MSKKEIGLRIYIVTAGSYSDYHILAVFSTLGGAQAFIDACPKPRYYGDDYDIEEYGLDEGSTLLEQGYQTWRIRFDSDLTIQDVEWDKFEAELEDPVALPYERGVQIWVHAKDEAHARKIAGEKVPELYGLVNRED